jgi:hypothetical protein
MKQRTYLGINTVDKVCYKKKPISQGKLIKIFTRHSTKIHTQEKWHVIGLEPKQHELAYTFYMHASIQSHEDPGYHPYKGAI